MILKAFPSSQAIVQALLEDTGQLAPPTNPEKIAEYLDLRVVYFHNHDDYQLNQNIRAFLWPKKHLIGVYAGLMRVQHRFSILHEIGHYVLPDHLDLESGEKHEDDKRNFGVTQVSKRVKQKEVEANQFAADCLFQLAHFDNHIKSTELTWMNIIDAADLYGASIEATARRWIENTQTECALVVFKPGRDRTQEPLLEIMYSVVSKRFHYFTGLQSGQTMNRDSMVHQLFYNSSNLQSAFWDSSLEVQLAQTIVPFKMLLFTNSYRVLAILFPE